MFTKRDSQFLTPYQVVKSEKYETFCASKRSNLAQKMGRFRPAWQHAHTEFVECCQVDNSCLILNEICCSSSN